MAIALVFERLPRGRLCVAMIWFLCALHLSARQNPPTPKSEAQKAIDEFRVQTSRLAIRADTQAALTKRPRMLSEWHGRLYENMRNNFLDAVPHEVKQRGLENAILRRNQFGFNATGPLSIPKLLEGGKTHLSLSYEGVRQRISQPYLRTVPTMAERSGDFEAAVNQAGQFQPMYDARSTAPNPRYDPSQPVSMTNLQYLRDPYPGNMLPSTLLDPVAQKALAYYPRPNTAVGPYYQNNYFVDPPATNRANGWIGTLDQQLAPKHQLTWGVGFSTGAFGAARLFANDWSPGLDDQRTKDERAQLTYMYVLSPEAVNSLSFSARSVSSIGGEELSGNPAGQLGLAGVGTDAYPLFTLTPYLSMGHSSPYATRDTDSYILSDTFTAHRGQHAPQLLFQYGQYHATNLNSTYPAGSYTFSPTITGLPGVVGTGDAFASFLLGAADAAQATYISAASHFQRQDGFLGFHDHFIALKGLTIDYGINGHVMTPRIALDNQQTDIDLATSTAAGENGALVVAGVNGIPRGFRPTRLLFEPAVGIAFTPSTDQRMVVRASYRRFYQPIQMGGSQNNTQGFNEYTNLVSPYESLEPATYLSAGFPSFGRLPNLSETAANNTIADLIDMSGRLPTLQSATFSLEHGFGSNLLTAAFAYSGGKNVLVGNNAADPDALPISALQYRDELNVESFNRSLRPFPQFLDFNLNGNYPAGRYERSEATIRWERRASSGLAFDALLDLSKQMDDYSGPYGRQNYFDDRSEWSLTPGNRPITLQFNCSWELPLGEGKRFLQYGDWRRYITSGWTIRVTGSVYSGTPLELISEFNNTGGVASTLQVNTVPGVNAAVTNQGPVLWYNPAAFVQPPDFTLGSVSRTLPSIRNPSFQNYDLNLGKRMVLDSRRTLEFNILVLNALNHGNWNNPDNLIGPANAPNTDAGHIIGSAGGRVVQLGARVTF